VAIAVALGLCAPLPAQAALIDDFNTGVLVISDGGLGFAAGVGIVGGEREMQSGVNTTGEFSSNKAGNGLLIMTFASGPVAATFFDIVYDGADNSALQDFTGLNGADFTDGGTSDAIRVRLVESTIALHVEITVQQQVNGENWFLQHTIDVGPVAAPTDVFFPFADFTLSCSFCGTASFSSIDWMKVRFFPVNATGAPFQASVDFIQTQTMIPDGPRDVPAPPVLPLLAGGVVWLGIQRRLAKAPKA
jgi:hypothetical protein